MEKTIQEILQTTLGEEVRSVLEINGLGSVNQVFEAVGQHGSYIIRLNDEPPKELEYLKEQWCLEKVAELGIPSPKVIGMGTQNHTHYMILEKVHGINGTLCSQEEKESIWRSLGRYAEKYQHLQHIAVPEVEKAEFHANWQARLAYNLKELNAQDSLLRNQFLHPEEHQLARAALSKIENREFRVGLVHGDLCPRNVIWKEGTTHLLDWGTAEINVVPHIEIGLVLVSKEASQEEYTCFLEGLGVSSSDFKAMEKDIHILNLLHQLDKYRWAEGQPMENLGEFAKKVRKALQSIGP